MSEKEQLSAIVTAAQAATTTQTDLAIALHDYVRDHIAFGFTPYFDAATNPQTLRLRTGHCNPQARLMVGLFRVAGFNARFRPATITNDVLDGAATTPPRLSHVFTEVEMDDRWVRLDSYIIDPALCRAATARLRAESRRIGYGCHVNATGDWDGRSDAYSQVADADMIVELHDPVDDLDRFFQSSAYQHRVGFVSYNLLFAPGRLLPSLAMASLNARLHALRAGK
jgi:hypothetical protein